MSKIIKDQALLGQVSTKVDTVSEALEIIEKLESTLKQYPNGYGLSAIQIGIPKRVAVVKYGRHGSEFIRLINPEFIEKGEEFTFVGEGCLSFPNVYLETKRLKEFTIKNNAIDNGVFREEELYFHYADTDHEDKFESIAVEHEMDHFDGLTILDYGKKIPAPVPVERENPKVSRNDPCPCGSNKKYKKCCLGKLAS